MSWDRNNLAPHALPSVLCDFLSSSSAGLNLGRHLGQFGTFPMVTGKGPNTSVYKNIIAPFRIQHVTIWDHIGLPHLIVINCQIFYTNYVHLWLRLVFFIPKQRTFWFLIIFEKWLYIWFLWEIRVVRFRWKINVENFDPSQ